MVKWFLNKTTGMKWNIYDIEHQERLLKDDNYELIEDPFVIEEESQEDEKLEDVCEIEEVKESIDYSKLSYPQLQAIAKERNIKSVGVSKANLIKSLEKEGE